jgi:single-strand DNA-binding protein
LAFSPPPATFPFPGHRSTFTYRFLTSLTLFLSSIRCLQPHRSAILNSETEYFFMAKGVNKVFLLGNVGKDPEIRTTAGGMTVASFSLATAERAKDAQGNWADKTEWHNLVAFQRTAEIVRDYVKKGTQVFIEGKIQTRSWDDKESGQKKYRTEILINELSLLGGGAGRGEGASSSSGGYSSSRSSSSAPASAPSNDYADQGITDEDIPF